ncbi:MAG: SDR family oxidoreductase [Burkholderiaceae bacterium]
MTKHAIVTGASGGIGTAIAQRLLAQDMVVWSLSRRAPGFADANLRHLSVDLLDRVALADALHTLTAEHAITTLVHNAGAIRAARVPEVQLADLDALAQLHLGCAVQLLQATLPAMQSHGFGRVVLLSSRAALGLSSRTAYSATKAGMLGMARTWALELAGQGITVNVVAPGPIAETEMFDAVIPRGSEREAALAQAIPVQRLGKPADVARAVTFFTDAEADFVTGQVLYVCGGSSVGSLSL